VTENVLFAQLLDRPLLLAKGAAVVLLDPERHTALVKRMVALSPDNDTVFPTTRVNLSFRLTSETGIHHLNSANGAGVALDVPAPHGHSIPLLEGEHLPRLSLLLRRRCVGLLTQCSKASFSG